MLPDISYKGIAIKPSAAGDRVSDNTIHSHKSKGTVPASCPFERRVVANTCANVPPPETALDRLRVFAGLINEDKARGLNVAHAIAPFLAHKFVLTDGDLRERLPRVPCPQDQVGTDRGKRITHTKLVDQLALHLVEIQSGIDVIQVRGQPIQVFLLHGVPTATTRPPWGSKRTRLTPFADELSNRPSGWRKVWVATLHFTRCHALPSQQNNQAAHLCSPLAHHFSLLPKF
mmetsp:Transcript_79961/g.159649  ORF Transcript_79961/g.159649 Transcript_79961/m.159649 type:complete len:231 (-) Transcript_79961:56-748(-)